MTPILASDLEPDLILEPVMVELNVSRGFSSEQQLAGSFAFVLGAPDLAPDPDGSSLTGNTSGACSSSNALRSKHNVSLPSCPCQSMSGTDVISFRYPPNPRVAEDAEAARVLTDPSGTAVLFF